MPNAITIRKEGGTPFARITIGQAQFGKFGVYVFQRDKTTFHAIGIGHVPPGQQSFAMGDVSTLDGEFLVWDVVLAPFPSTPGQLFSVRMDIVQDGAVVNSFTDSGQFNGTAPKAIHSSASITCTLSTDFHG